MVIDLPPGTGDVQLSLIQKLKISGSLIVTTPQDIALIDVIRGLKMFEKTKVPILGIVENMSYFLAPDTGKEYKLYGESKTNEVAEKYDYEILANLPHEEDLRVFHNHIFQQLHLFYFHRTAYILYLYQVPRSNSCFQQCQEWGL